MTLDDAPRRDPADRRELKRRIDGLGGDAETLLRWVCDQRIFDRPHN